MDENRKRKRGTAENTGIKASSRSQIFIGGSVTNKIVSSDTGSINTGLDAQPLAMVRIAGSMSNDINQGVTVGIHNRDPLEWKNDGWREWRDTIKDLIAGEKPTELYKLKGKCGALIVCNHFDDKRNKIKGYKEKKRHGAEVDVSTLQDLFKNSLKCGIVQLEENVKGPEIQKTLEEFQKDLIAKNCDSCVVVIMSHGGETANSILMDDMQERNFHRDFLYHFSHNKFPSFEGKPKIFLVQACQDYGDEELPAEKESPGEKGLPAKKMSLVHKGLPLEESSQAQEELPVEKGLPAEEAWPQAKRPKESHRQDQDVESEVTTPPLDFESDNDEIQDVIVGFATIPYQTALRGDDGSIFIQSVVKIFREHAHKYDLRDMLKMVHDDVLKISKQSLVKETSPTGEIIVVPGNQISSVFDIGFRNYKFNI